MRRTAFLAALLMVPGCAIFTRPPFLATLTDHASPDVPDDGYHDFTGVIHIHTEYSDGAGTFEDIAKAGNAQRLDFLIATDHNTLQPLRDGKQGWYGSTLVLAGCELSTRGGHYLALNIAEEIDRHAFTTQQIIDQVSQQGGLGFIAHPYFKKRRWTDWSVHGFTGIEGYNVAHDSIDENKLRLALWTLSVPVEPFYSSILDRPYDPLRKWDELIAQHGRVVGIGASDAHEVRVMGMKFAPYEVMFRLIRTHVLVPSKALAAEEIYDALRQGHAYFSVELMTSAKGFSWLADLDGKVAGIMGDTVELAPGLRLTSALPTDGRTTLFRDGQPVSTTTEQVWHVPVTEPGAYRIEVTREGKPWIFSNPIYVRSLDTEQLQ